MSRVWGRHAPTRLHRKCRRIEEVKSRMDRKFSRIENLWLRDGSCPLPLRSKRFISKCFRIVKTQKISKRSLLMYGSHRLLRTKFLPLFMQRRWRKVGITFGRLMRFSRCVSRKRKIPPMQHSDGFCRVKQRQNESGVLRGGKFFCGLSLTEVVGLTVITNHFLWLCSKWTRPHLVDEFEPIHKINGIYKKNTTACRMRQEGFEKFIEVKQEKYDTSCSFRKKYAMWIRTTPIFCLR